MKIHVWRGRRAECAVLCAVLAVVGCDQQTAAKAGAALEGGVPKPDVLPVMLNKELPFRYPPALYADKTQGNVTLHLYIDKAGGVVNDSTRVVESSNVPMLDSAALKGSRELRFQPAMSRGAPMAVAIMFPVYFRHPEAGDSAAARDSAAAKDSAAKGTAKDTAKDTASKKKKKRQ